MPQHIQSPYCYGQSLLASFSRIRKSMCVSTWAPACPAYGTVPAQYLHRNCTVHAPYLDRTCTVPAPYLHRTIFEAQALASLPELRLQTAPVHFMIEEISLRMNRDPLLASPLRCLFVASFADRWQNSRRHSGSLFLERIPRLNLQLLDERHAAERTLADRARQWAEPSSPLLSQKAAGRDTAATDIRPPPIQFDVSWEGGG